MASAHAPCPRAIHVVYPDSLTRYVTCIPHPTRLPLAPTALVSSAVGSFPPHCRWHSAPCPRAIYMSSTRTHPTVSRNTTDALTPHEPSPSPHAGRSFPPTSARATYSSSRLPALTRPSPTALPTISPLERVKPVPTMAESLPPTCARGPRTVRVPCLTPAPAPLYRSQSTSYTSQQ